MKGKTGDWNKSAVLTQPVQIIKREEKTEQWRKENLDWWEHVGVMQLRQKYKRLKKNYNLAGGIVDKSDYIPDTSQNEYGEMIGLLTTESESPYEIRFYPIIPNVKNVLKGEFAKRNSKVFIKAVDEYAINEMLEKKKEMVTDYLIQKTQQTIALKLSQQGIPLESEQAQETIKNIPNLPQIQEFFQKSYRSIAEQWAVHELNEADERFKLYELETQAFEDKLVANEEFWHVRLLDDDYQVELWNPLNTFYHKSPDVAYVSECNYVGRIHLLTIADVIDRFGFKMTEAQIKGLQRIGGLNANIGKVLPSDAMPTDWWDTTKKPKEQVQSIHWNQSVAMQNFFGNNPINKPLFEWLKEEDNSFTQDYLIVTEVYWKSQKRIGNLKQIDEQGNMFEDIVSEEFVVTLKPIYDVTINKKETKDNLIYGQHVDWIWVNEVWQGIKIGLSFINSWAGMSDSFEPIYLDIKPLPFQFKGDNSLYGAKLPVEGFLGYNRNTKKLSLVDHMKPFQIGYNMVNNQILDMLVDEVGKVIMLDQNMIPRNSLDGSWGKYNFSKAFQVMKNFGILPVDSSITNTDVPVNFSQTSAVDLSKTDQIASRVQLSDYFKNECYGAVGISRQRLGDVTSSESATGAEYAVNNSYAQTEMYFIEHSNYLMPRVKEMILNAAQYINANKATIRKSYINREEENIFFEVEGTKILLSDLKIYCSAKPDQKAVVDKLQQLAIQNNTSGATIFDLAKILQSSSVSEIVETLKSSVQKVQEQQEKELQVSQENTKMQIESEQELANLEREFKSSESELDRANERYVAEVRSLGFAKDTDINDNEIPDALEVSRFNAELGQHEDDILFQTQKLASEQLKSIKEQQIKQKELSLKQKQLEEDVRLKEKEIKLARDNQKNDLAIAKQNAKGRSKGTKR
jgi:hypothetical protein